MANKENCYRLAAMIEVAEKAPDDYYDSGDGFNMSNFANKCGTPRCIGGWAAWEALGRPAGNLYDVVNRLHTDMEREARIWLDIDISIGSRLFYPDFKPLSLITTEEAARVLRELGDTGELPDWWRAEGGDIDVVSD